MRKEDILKSVGDFIRSTFIIEDGKGISLQQSLLDAGIVDSTGVLELVSFLEQTFGITVEDEELIPDNLDSLERIASFVLRKLG